MVLIPTDAFDVVPRCGLVAAITLVHLSRPATPGYLRIFLPGNLFRNHVKMLHIVTRGRLVALGAIDRPWRGMAKSGDSPFCRPVARRALASKKTTVAVFGAVAARTIQCHFERCHGRQLRQGTRHGDLADPDHQLIGGLLLLTIRRRSLQLLQPNFR